MVREKSLLTEEDEALSIPPSPRQQLSRTRIKELVMTPARIHILHQTAKVPPPLPPFDAAALSFSLGRHFVRSQCDADKEDSSAREV